MYTRHFLSCLQILLGLSVSIKSFANNPEQDSALVNESLNQAAYYLNAAPNADSALFFLIQMEEQSKAMGWYPKYIQSLNGQVQVYLNEGDFSNAEQAGKKAIEEAEKFLNKDDPFLGQSYGNLGVLYAYLGNFPVSNSYYDKALHFINKDSDNLNDIATYMIFNLNMGSNAREWGDYYQALSYYEISRDIAKENEAVAPFFANQVINTRFEIAQLNWLLKKAEKSITGYQDCLGLVAEYQKTNQVIHLRILHSLARSLNDAERYQEASKIANEAISIQAKFQQVKQRSYEAEWPYQSLGKAYAAQGKPQIAESFFQQAIQILQDDKIDGKTNPRLGARLIDFAHFYRQSGQNENALSTYQEAIILFCNEFADTTISQNPALDDVAKANTKLIEAFRSKAELQYELADKQGGLEVRLKALATYQLVLGLIERDRQQYQAEGSKLFLLEQATPAYEGAIGLTIDLFHLTGEDQYATQAFQLAEKSKSILLFDAIKNSEARFAAGVPDSLLSQEQNLRSEIAYYQDQLYQENRKAAPIDSLLVQYRKEVFDRSDRLNRLVKQFETAFPSYYNLKYSSDNISLAEVQNKLTGTNSQLIEYFVGESSIFIIAITADGIKLNQVRKDADLEASLTQVLAGVHGEQVFDAKVFATASFALYERILAPLIDQSKARLIIIPDGQLGYLPFETLLTASQNAATPATYLIQSHSVHYAYSAQLLYRAPNPRSQKSPTLNWLGYAPNYQGTEALPYNQEEVKNISNLFGGEARYGEAANLADFMSDGVSARFLHLSMHGYPNEDNPMYSYLAFAGDSLNRLHAYQIFDLKLNTDLTVLSACKTAYGPLAQGEGIMSLSRAFRYAGCPSILTSLWSADGSVAKDLLVDFYNGLQEGKAKDIALRDAKLNYLQSAPPNRQNPRYWANFVLVGDAQALHNPWNMLWWILGVFLLLGLGLLFGWKFYQRKKALDS